VRVQFGGSGVRSDRRQRIHGHGCVTGPPDVGGGAPRRPRHGVIRFQHRRKIISILNRNTLAPIAIRTTPGSCLVTEGVKSENPELL
jgi:hypothetical protein